MVSIKETIKKTSFSKHFKNYYPLYIMLIPGLLFVLFMKFIPYFGSMLAFKDFSFANGDNMFSAMINSPWVGFKNFQRMFIRPDSLTAIINTFVLIFLKLVFLFPLPIILSILINEVRVTAVKRTMQTIVYFPYFLSWVVVASLSIQFLQNGGLLSSFLAMLGLPNIPFFSDPKMFRVLLIASDAWKGAGWGTIVYLAAITGIDPQLYEAATVDGCGRIKRIWYITIPSIVPHIVLLFTLSLGSQLAFGSFEQVLTLYNPSVYATGDIIQTYTYRIGLGKLDYSFATAVGLLNAIVATVFVFMANTVLKKTVGRSIW